MTKTNNIPQGYKNSDLGIIPEDWEVKEIKVIGQVFSGGTPDTTNATFWNGDINWCTPTDITALNGNKYIEETKTKITLAGLNNSSATILPSNSIIVCTRATVGKAVITKLPIATNQGFKNIVPFENANVQYHYYMISNSEPKLLRLGNGSTFLEVSKRDFEDFKFLLPPLPEQQKISEILSVWDAAIEKQNGIIEKFELRKRGLMQQLLTGKIKLKGFEETIWRIQPLENFIKPIVREVPKPRDPYLGIGLRSHGKGTFLKPDEQPEKNSMDKFYVVRPSDLIVNITFAWEQAIAIVRPEDDGALASHRFPTYTFIAGKGHPDFFKFFILQPRMKFMLEMISPGGAGRNRVMSKSDFIKLEFSLPEYKEQTAIAEILITANNQIELEKQKLTQLKAQKKGLMQLLLTGKKRVKIVD